MKPIPPRKPPADDEPEDPEDLPFAEDVDDEEGEPRKRKRPLAHRAPRAPRPQETSSTARNILIVVFCGFLMLCTLSAIGSYVKVAKERRAAADWTDFTPPEGGFAITFPSPLPPPCKEQNSVTPAGPIRVRMWQMTHGTRAYTVGHCDLPRILYEGRTLEELLELNIDGAVKATKGGRLVSSSPFGLGSAVGRDVVIAIPAPPIQGAFDMKLTARYFLTKTKLYQANVVYPDGEDASLDVAHFLDSFKITEK
ncbi:hypothetical protein HY251_03510 [bacterium]|nr:hypothetical protein [bacterium]